MAAPIQLEFKQGMPQEEVRRRLERAPVEHADALLALYDLLQLAQDRGVIDIVRGAIGRGDTIVVKLSQLASAPESVVLVRNLISLGRIAASFDPDVLGALADELEKEKARTSRPQGLLQTLGRLASKDTLRVLAASAAFVSAFGKALVAPRSPR